MSFMHGGSLLLGNNTVPGVELSPELKKYAPIILRACRDWGLDFYPTVIQLLTYDEISEIAAYGGFPVRFPHWSFGSEYEELQRGYEFGSHKIFEMVINCCGLATRILTNKGSKFAKDIRVGDIVVVGKETREVVAVKQQNASSTKKIKLKGYIKPIVCTPNHKWKVLTESGDVWKKTDEIQTGEIMLGCDSYCGFQNHPATMNTSTEEVHWQSKTVCLPSLMTLELAELVGAIIGDGSCGVKGNKNDIYITVGHDFPNYQKHVLELFENVFNTEARIQKKNGGVEVMLQSQMAVYYLNNNGLTAGSTYKNKRIPSCIWDSSQEFRAAFLRGLFDTDGYASDGLGMSAYNPDLISDVQIMLLEMGIMSFAETITNGKKYITVLDIRGKSNLEKFKERIGFSIDYKKEELDSLINTEFCRGGGIRVPFIQNKLIEWADENKISTYNNPSLGRSIKNMKKRLVGINCLYSFIERVVLNSSYSVIRMDVLNFIRTPLLIVEEVVEGEVVETVDIALNHDAHDFIADGLLSHNTNPCYQWLLSSNTLADNLTVIAHATGHNDFFKNNIHFSATDTNMLNKMANHGTRIRKYATRWGKERVTEFLDHVMRLETLIDGAEAWTEKAYKDPIVRDEKREYRQPRRLNVDKNRMYMEPFINTKEFRKKENERILEADLADEIGAFKNPTRNILGFLRDNAPLKPWQADIVSMLYEEAMYFFPQRQTKTGNEGWASLTDAVIMAEQGYISLGQEHHDSGIIEYAEHKMSVLGGKYSVNPYKLGYYLLSDIRNRWDKGQFGHEWDECTDIRQKEKWDTKAGLGKEKIFEVRKYYDDLTLLHEFFTEDFCRDQEYFHWKHYPNGEFRIENRDFKEIKKALMQRHLNGGLPNIKLTEPNYRGDGSMMLQHEFDGRPIYKPYIADVLSSIRAIWGADVYLSTKDEEQEKIYCCYGTDAEKDVEIVNRKTHLKRG